MSTTSNPKIIESVMPPAAIPSSPPPSPPLGKASKEVPKRAQSRPRARSPSPEPVLRSPPPPPTAPPTPPATTTTVDPLRAPARTPPPPPPTLPKMAPQKPVVPMQTFNAEPTPAPSALEDLLQKEATQNEHPISYMPPSPPLTRTSTTSQKTSTIAPASARIQNPAPSVLDSLIRPSAVAGSSASLKEVRKVGKSLGQNPIDYLLPNGSLPRPVSAKFHPTQDPLSVESDASDHDDDEEGNPVAGIFGNLNFLLNSYLTVLSAGGSLAVGTGYRSVARRLLERTEGIFARDLGVKDVGWPDVLEYIRGTRTKPVLCVLPVRGLLSKGGDESVLSIDPRPTPGLTAAAPQQQQPMGKVESWLSHMEQVLKSSEESEPVSLTKEEEAAEDRIVIKIVENILSSNGCGEQIKHFHRYLDNTTLISTAKLALSRLYPDHPPESITPPIIALYLLMHPDLHPILLAISNVSESELDLIHSGRFDAFLDGSTKIVSRDEDEELVTISRLDKRLWTVLEGLEDEIEELHTRALIVRRALKARKEQISKKRICDDMTTPSVSLLDVPAPAPEEAEEEWAHNVPSLHLPITPDDSASNISATRRRRQRSSKKEKSGKSKVSTVDEAGTEVTERRKEKKEKKERAKSRAREEESTTVTTREREGRSEKHHKEKERDKEHHRDREHHKEKEDAGRGRSS